MIFYELYCQLKQKICEKIGICIHNLELYYQMNIDKKHTYTVYAMFNLELYYQKI